MIQIEINGVWCGIGLSVSHSIGTSQFATAKALVWIALFRDNIDNTLDVGLYGFRIMLNYWINVNSIDLAVILACWIKTWITNRRTTKHRLATREDVFAR